MAGSPSSAAAQPTDAVLDALGDPTRRAIVVIVAEGPIAVSELAERLPVSRPAVSRHLKLLKSAGLVSSSAEGTRRLYQLEAAGVGAARGYFEDLWNQAGARFTLAADNLGTDDDAPDEGPAT